MRIGHERAEWTHNWGESELADVSSEATAQRAGVIASSGFVRTLVASDDGATLMATARSLFSTQVHTVRVNYAAGSLTSTCSCQRSERRGGEGADPDVPCEHAIAAIIDARDAPSNLHRPRRPRRDGGRAGSTAEPPEPATDPVDVPAVPGVPQPGERAAPLWRAGRTEEFDAQEVRVGLEISMTNDDHVEIRPVRRIGTGRYRAAGNGWAAFTSPTPPAWARNRAADAIFDIYQVFLRARRATFAFGSRRVQLDRLGSDVWPAIAAADRAGVDFVMGAGLPEGKVTVAPEPSEIRLELTTLGDGALRVTATLGPARDRAQRIVPLGRPMHGALVINAEGGQLVRLLTPALPELREICASGAWVYSGPSKQRFLTETLPRLALHVQAESPDGTVEIPTIERPRLRCALASEAATLPTVRLEYSLHSSALTGRALRDVAADQLRRLRLSAPGAVRDLLPNLESADDDAADTLTWQTWARGTAQVRAVTRDLIPWLTDQRDVELTDVTVAEIDEEAATPEVALAAAPPAAGPSSRSAAAWVGLDVDVSVGGERVPFALLFSALTTGAEILHLASGVWIRLDHPSLEPLRALIEAARDLTEAGENGAVRLSVSAFDVEAARAIERIGGANDPATEAWIERLSALADLDREAPAQVAPPQSVRAELRDYQRTGLAWAAHLWRAGLGGVLADDMGLGKTLQMLATIALMKEEGRLTHEGEPRPVLVIAPTSVVSGWCEQAAVFTPNLRVHAMSASARKSGRSVHELAAAHDVVVTSYSLARIEAEALAQEHFAAVLIDEAQFVKNPTSKTFRAVRELRADVVIAMTGTPLENSLVDLWAMFALVAPGLLGPLKTFKNRFRTPIEDSDIPEVRERARQQLRSLIEPFLLRRTKATVAAELPAKQDQVLAVTLDPDHRRRYDAQLARERQRVLGLLEDADRNRVAILRSLTTLRRLALDPRLIRDEEDSEAEGTPPMPREGESASAKTRVLLDHLRSILAEDHRALVFSQFTSYLALVREELEAAGIACCYLDGGTRDRAAEIERFRRGEAPVFLISLKAGGFGLNLTEADYVFLLDPWWNPAVEEQAVDRTHRIGQTRAVNVYRLVAAETIEDKVLALQERKRRLFDDVIGEGSDTSGVRLSGEEVRRLLQG
ncbi:MAG: DEAD/DEAH box helicase [Bowdeniella nasicola]|nr:DEAD/DEAH box helicase [Bowdeniella nasicola]